MKKLFAQINDIEKLISSHDIKSVSFDIDGTLYPIMKVQMKWWLSFFKNPVKAIRFVMIRKKWEERREGIEHVIVSSQDTEFFEKFLIEELLSEKLVPSEIRSWLEDLKKRGLKLYFLSDHGAAAKLNVLRLSEWGEGINCLGETNQLKPHVKITEMLTGRYQIIPETHLHVGDRWTDEKQAELLGSFFSSFSP